MPRACIHKSILHQSDRQQSLKLLIWMPNTYCKWFITGNIPGRKPLRTQIMRHWEPKVPEKPIPSCLETHPTFFNMKSLNSFQTSGGRNRRGTGSGLWKPEHLQGFSPLASFWRSLECYTELKYVQLSPPEVYQHSTSLQFRHFMGVWTSTLHVCNCSKFPANISTSSW